MSCKNDQDWEGSYVYKQDCVQWTDLVRLREKFNQVWDILKKEDRQDNVKYGYSTDEEENAKEQTRHDLATINGFVSIRFNEAGDYDEIYFRITSGSILQRLERLGSEYSYDNQVGGQSANFGPWIVYLKDPCYGCTGFRFQNADIPYTRSIACNCMDGGGYGGCFPSIDIDPPGWKAQCIWTLSGGCDTSRGATPISDWQQYCNFNFDWRSSPYYQNKFGDVASKLFAKEICAPVGKPCTVSRNYCCDEYALAHYTEEFMDHSLCPENETAIAAGLPFSAWPYRLRRLKWVSLGVTLTNPQDEQQPFDDDTFFCCDNTITGGVFEGHVTQKISAIHLTNIWDRVNSMVGGKTLRTCEKEKCQFDPENPKEKDKWHFKATVPMYVEGGGTPDILDRKIPDQFPPSPCQNCDRVDVGDPICACNFNDVNHLLDEYLQTCECSSGNYMWVKDKEYRTLSIYGPIDDCGCCCWGSTPWINTVSVSKSCTVCGNCGETPCTSTKAQYKDGKCASAAQVCQPNWANLSPAEKCGFSKRYLTVTTVDMSGGGNHGRTQVRQYTTDNECDCNLDTTCSGSITTTVTSISEHTSSSNDITCTSSFNTTDTTVRTFNSDCTHEDVTTCSGSASFDVVNNGNVPCLGYGCESTANEDCTWDGSVYYEGPNQNGTGCETVTFPFSGASGGCSLCDGATIESTTEVSPEPDCTVTVTYSGEENQTQLCSPKQFPSFPLFTKCTPEGEEPPEPPELQPGQGYEGTAYNFTDKNNPKIESEQRFKYRIEHYVPPTCYLQVWVTKVVQKWQQVDYCTEYETTTDSNGCPTTKEVKGEECSYDETKFFPCNGCCNLWKKDGDPTETTTTYVFSGGNPPCLKNDEKERYDCENIEYGNEVTVTASKNTEVYVYIKKYSYSASHTPNDPAGESCPQAPWLQGCKPDGCPVPEWERDSSKCPKCSDYKKGPC